MNTTIDNRYIWLDGDIVHLPDAKINILSPTAQFGANVFEGIRCYWNDEEQQLYAFRLDDHYKRLKNSMKMFRMEDKYTIEELKKALIDVVQANNYKEDIAVRQTVFIDGFGTWSSAGPINMFVAPVPKARKKIMIGKGIKACVSSWERISDRNMSPKVKVGANYINSRMAQIEALQNGYDSAIFMNNQGKIAEGPGSCFFMVRNGTLITPPITASILESITRDTVIELAKNVLNINVIEREIDRSELYICEEAFLCGSAVEVTPIESIDGIKVNENYDRESIVNNIHQEYLTILTGKKQYKVKWCQEIY